MSNQKTRKLAERIDMARTVPQHQRARDLAADLRELRQRLHDAADIVDEFEQALTDYADEEMHQADRVNAREYIQMEAGEVNITLTKLVELIK